MTLAFLGAALFVLVVCLAVVPFRAPARPGRRPRFPWFWVVFPVTVLALVSAVGVVLALAAGVHETDHRPVDLVLTYPDFGGDNAVQFLTNEQWRLISGPLDPLFYVVFWPVAAFAGVVLLLWFRDRDERMLYADVPWRAAMSLVSGVAANLLGAVSVIYYAHHTSPPVPTPDPLPSTPIPDYVGPWTVAGLAVATVAGVAAVSLALSSRSREHAPRLAYAATWIGLLGPVVTVIAAIYGTVTTPVPY